MDIENPLKILGMGIAAAGLFFTGFQIKEANKTLIFTTEQNLYKESRDILKYISNNPKIYTLAHSADLTAG